MATIAEAVKETVESDMRIYDALRLGIVNNRRLAKHIQHDVSRLVGQNATVNTIAVALQRLGAKIKLLPDKKYSEIFSQSHLQLRDDISILYIKGNPEPDGEEAKSGGFLVKIQGIGSTTVFADDDTLAKMDYKKADILKKISSLSAIIITSPHKIVETPGVIAHLMMALGGSGINVVEVTSSYDNTFLIVEKKDSLKAVEIIRSLIKRSRT